MFVLGGRFTNNCTFELERRGAGVKWSERRREKETEKAMKRREGRHEGSQKER